MKTLVTTLACLFVLSASAAVAQTTRNSNPSAGSANPAVSAPIGHRQPRVGEVPSEKNIDNPNDPINREDAALDRKLKSICRGC